MNEERFSRFAAGLLGMIAVVAQTVLLREFLAVVEGNELVLGLVLACWMLLTGAGAFLARWRGGRTRLNLRMLVLATLPLCTAVGLRIARQKFFAPGTMVDLPGTVTLAVVVLAPFCVLSGHTFVRLAETISAGGRSIALAYGWEAAGSVLGGATGFIVTGWMTGNITILSGTLVAGAWASCFLTSGRGVSRSTVIPAAALTLAAILWAGEIDRWSRALLVPGQQLIFSRDTPYGSLVVAEHAGQRALYENGVLLGSTGDVVGKEESVHFAMVQREAPRRVLVVSGIASGVLEEVFKYPVTAVDYVELNPGIGTSESRLRPVPEDPRLRMVEGDVRAFLRSEPGLFDVLLVNTPDPTTAQSNRLFTLEFFRLARSHMTDSSVLAISLLPSVEYYGDRARLVGSSVFTTLREIFPEVAVVPGDRNYFLASGTPLDVGIARLVAKRGIATTAVNAYYIDDDLLRARSAEFVGSLDTLVRRNGDLSPIAYFRQIALWLESLGVRAEVMGWATVLIVLAALGILPKVETGVYAAGFAAAGIEVIALLGYQCLYGFVYHSLWLVTGGFMAGLAAGSAVSARVGPLSAERLFLRGLIVMGLCSGGVAILLEILVRHGRAVTPGTVALLGLIALAGAATGAVFGAGSALVPGEARRIAGGLYAVDLAGSALGSLLTVVFLVPLAGTDLAAASVGVLPLAAALLYTIRR